VATTQKPQATVAVTAFGACSAERTAREMVLRLDIVLLPQISLLCGKPLKAVAMARILAGRMTNL
jgi:hypothetical protein